MTDIDDEHAAALGLIQSTPRGPEVIAALPSLADSFATRVSNSVPSVGLVFQLFGRQAIVDAIHTNFVLMLGRLLVRARAFDSASLQDRTVPLVQLLSIAAAKSKQWASRHEEAVHPIHDKKERLKHRRTLAHEEKSRSPAAAEALVKALWSAITPILFPKGSSSLFLPAGGSLLLSIIDKELDNPSLLRASPDQSEKIARAAKTVLLFWALERLRAGLRPEETPRYTVPPELLGAIEPFLPSLRDAFITFTLPDDHTVAPKTVAETLARSLLSFTQSFPLESILMTVVLDFSEVPALFRTEKQLDALIDQLSHDEGIARTIIGLATPTIDLGLSGDRDLSSSFWGLLMQGLTSAVADTVIAEILESFDWENAQKTVLERLRWFLFSSYADEAVKEWVQKS